MSQPHPTSALRPRRRPAPPLRQLAPRLSAAALVAWALAALAAAHPGALLLQVLQVGPLVLVARMVAITILTYLQDVCCLTWVLASLLPPLRPYLPRRRLLAALGLTALLLATLLRPS